MKWISFELILVLIAVKYVLGKELFVPDTLSRAYLNHNEVDFKVLDDFRSEEFVIHSYKIIRQLSMSNEMKL